MPSGQTHALITAAAAGGLLAVSVATGQPAAARWALVGGCLAGLLLTPDLDVDEGARSHSLVRENAGRLAGAAWRLAWLPYARLMPHRHWLSHAPVIGTLGRVGYLLAIVWAVLALAGRPWPWPSVPTWALWALAGLMVSDALHWAADMGWTYWQRRLRRIWRRRRMFWSRQRFFWRRRGFGR